MRPLTLLGKKNIHKIPKNEQERVIKKITFFVNHNYLCNTVLGAKRALEALKTVKKKSKDHDQEQFESVI